MHYSVGVELVVPVVDGLSFLLCFGQSSTWAVSAVEASRWYYRTVRTDFFKIPVHVQCRSPEGVHRPGLVSARSHSQRLGELCQSSNPCPALALLLLCSGSSPSVVPISQLWTSLKRLVGQSDVCLSISTMPSPEYQQYDKQLATAHRGAAMPIPRKSSDAALGNDDEQPQAVATFKLLKRVSLSRHHRLLH